MPTGQQYGTNVPQVVLTSGITAVATTMPVSSTLGMPSVPFTATLDIGQSNQEPVDVTNISGLNLTITRAIDGTTAQAHNVNATVTHSNIARDFREPRSHIDAASSPDAVGHSVHGLIGGSSVVGTADSQTLTNKVISSGQYTGSQTMGTGAWSGTGTLTEAAVRFTGLTGATAQTSGIVGAFSTAATTAGPTTGTFSTGDIVVDTTFNSLWVCTAGGTPGTWVPLGGRVKLGTTAPTGASTTINVPSWVNTIQGAYTARTNNAAAGGFVNLQFNGDTGNNYAWEIVLANTATVSGQNSAGATNMIHIGAKTAANDTANYFGSGSFWIPNAQNTSMFKSAHSGFNAVGSPTNGFAGTMGGTWANTAAITSVTLLPDAGNFVAGSSFTLYGLA